VSRFAIDESKLAAWLDTQLSGAGELDIDQAWDPQDYGQETAVYDLVRQAHGQAIIAPEGMSVAFCYCDDSAGGRYCWLVDIAAAGPRGLRLASAFEEMRQLAPGEQAGRQAAESILREAAEQANRCLAALAGRAAPRGAEEVEAVLAQARLARVAAGPGGGDPGWLAGAADALAWALGQDTSAGMAQLARAAPARASAQEPAAPDPAGPPPGPGAAAQAAPSGPAAELGDRRQRWADPETSPIATVAELIIALEDFDDDDPVRLAFQPGWPFEHHCGQVAQDDDGTVWIAEGDQIGYLPDPARQALGW
jgi:hypothetical protein